MTEQSKKKKKLTLNTAGLILLVIVIVAYFYVWQAKTKAEAQLLVLNDNVAAVKLQARAVDVPADDMEARLEEVKAELAAAQTGFPNTVDRNEVLDYLLDVAGDFGIQILPLESSGWSAENVGRQYEVLRITAIAEGSLKDVESFITGLQSGRYPTLVISDCSVERKDALAPGFPGDEMQVIVHMNIGIFTIASPLTEDSL